MFEADYFKVKDIKGYEGLYAVTRNGEVYSYKRKKFLKAGKAHNGYLYVVLCKGGKKKTYFVHRLVAQAYIENPENKGDVNHKDGNKENNNVNNLEWCSRKENINHAWNSGLCEKTRKAARKVGKQNCIKNFSKEVEVTFPNGETKTYYSVREACRRLDLYQSTINNCINYRNGYYKKQNLRFKYVEKEK